MDNEVLAALLGVFGTVIVGLLGLCGILVRRNGKQEPHNPNFETLQMLLEQVLDCSRKIDSNTNKSLMALAGLQGSLGTLKEAVDNLKDVVGSCGAVQHMRGDK